MQGRAVRALAARNTQLQVPDGDAGQRSSSPSGASIGAGPLPSPTMSMTGGGRISGSGFRTSRTMMESFLNSGLESAAVPKETVIKWVQHEIEVQKACHSLPFTVLFWIVFIATQWSHRHVGTSYGLQLSTRKLVEQTRRINSTLFTDSALAYTGDASVASLAFNNIESVDDALEWLEETLVPILWLDSKGTCPACYVNIFNRVIGGVRLQQIRLDQVSDCPGNIALNDYYGKSCYSESGDRHTGQFGQWTDTQSGFVSKEDYYNYWLDIEQDFQSVIDHVHFLERNQWLGDATEDLFFETNLYNGQLGFIVYLEAHLRLERGGTIKTKVNSRVLPTKIYHNVGIILGDICLVILLLLMTAGECLKLYRVVKERGFASYLHLFSAANWAVIILGAGLCMYFSYLVVAMQRLADDIASISSPPTTEVYQPGNWGWLVRHVELDAVFDEARRLKSLLDASETVTFWYTLIIVVKFFEAFSASPRLAIMTETLKRSFVDLFHFVIVFGTIFLTFALGGYVLFGHQLREWSSYDKAVTTSFRSLVGDFDWNSMYNVGPVNATVWFWSFMLLNFLIMLNMLLAIIMEVYCDVRDETKQQGSLADTFQALMGSWRLYAAGKSLQDINKRISTAKDGFISMKNLKDLGLSEYQSKLFLQEMRKTLARDRDYWSDLAASGLRKAALQSVEPIVQVDPTQVGDEQRQPPVQQQNSRGSTESGEVNEIKTMVTSLLQRLRDMENSVKQAGETPGNRALMPALPAGPMLGSAPSSTLLSTAGSMGYAGSVGSLPGAVEDPGGSQASTPSGRGGAEGGGRSAAGGGGVAARTRGSAAPAPEEMASLSKAIAETEVAIARGKLQLEALQPTEPSPDHDSGQQTERSSLLEEKASIQKEMDARLLEQLAKISSIQDPSDADSTREKQKLQEELESLRADYLARLAESKAKISSMDEAQRFREAEHSRQQVEYHQKRATITHMISAFETERARLLMQLDRLKASAAGPPSSGYL